MTRVRVPISSGGKSLSFVTKPLRHWPNDCDSFKGALCQPVGLFPCTRCSYLTGGEAAGGLRDHRGRPCTLEHRATQLRYALCSSFGLSFLPDSTAGSLLAPQGREPLEGEMNLGSGPKLWDSLQLWWK